VPRVFFGSSAVLQDVKSIPGKSMARNEISTINCFLIIIKLFGFYVMVGSNLNYS
jgi:hypothetical protein